MLFSFRKFISSMSSNRRHNIFPPKLLKKSSTSQDKQYFLLRLSLFSSASARSTPPPLSLFPRFNYSPSSSVSILFRCTLPSHVRARVNTDGRGEGEHPIRWPTSVRGLHLRPFRPRGSLLTRTTRKPSTHDFSSLSLPV